jgi:hypothetical protein
MRHCTVSNGIGKVGELLSGASKGGDIIHSSEAQFEHPEVTVQYDVDPSARTRLRAFEFAADTGILVASAHISFPGLGHVRQVGAAYRRVPIPYNATATELDSKP